MTPAALPAATALGAVHLTVRDLEGALAFYTQQLGLRLHGREGARARLGAGGADLLVLTGAPRAPRPHGTTGLYHLAVLVPARADLARVLRRLLVQRTPLQGASDHGVSEALYLADPEGNGIELTCDRPREQWPFAHGALRMVTAPLDADGLLAVAGPNGSTPAPLPAGTRIGHVHLQVGDLAAAERFWAGTLGFDVVQRYGRGALFLSAGGYHHHVGLNTWAGVGAPPPPPGAAGLDAFEVRLPDAPALAALRDRARAAGEPLAERGGALELVDPSQHHVRFLVPSQEAAS